MTAVGTGSLPGETSFTFRVSIRDRKRLDELAQRAMCSLTDGSRRGAPVAAERMSRRTNSTDRMVPVTNTSSGVMARSSSPLPRTNTTSLPPDIWISSRPWEQYITPREKSPQVPVGQARKAANAHRLSRGDGSGRKGRAAAASPTLYEDEHLIVVNKPAKLLSVANDKE